MLEALFETESKSSAQRHRLKILQRQLTPLLEKESIISSIKIGLPFKTLSARAASEVPQDWSLFLARRQSCLLPRLKTEPQTWLQTFLLISQLYP